MIARRWLCCVLTLSAAVFAEKIPLNNQGYFVKYRIINTAGSYYSIVCLIFINYNSLKTVCPYYKINIGEIYMYNIGKRLRELRTAAQLTQEQTAMTANITPAFLGQIERGEKNPTVVTVEKLCGVFRMSLSEFFSDCKYRSTGDVQIDKIVALLSHCSEDEKSEILRLLRSVLRFRSIE